MAAAYPQVRSLPSTRIAHVHLQIPEKKSPNGFRSVAHCGQAKVKLYCWVSSLWVGTLAPEREHWDQAGPLWPAPTLLCSASCLCVQCKTVLERRFRRLRQAPWGQSRGTDPPLMELEAGLVRQSRGCTFGAGQSAWLEQTCCPDDLSSHVAKGGVSSDEGGRSCSEQD